MKYLDNKFKIMKFFAKPKRSGQLMLAHLKFLKEGSNDYSTLLDLEFRRQKGKNVSELIPWTDGEFDLEKIKGIFVERKKMTRIEFETAYTELQNEGYLETDKTKAKQVAVDIVVEMESIHMKKIKLIDINK